MIVVDHVSRSACLLLSLIRCSPFDPLLIEADLEDFLSGCWYWDQPGMLEL